MSTYKLTDNQDRDGDTHIIITKDGQTIDLSSGEATLLQRDLTELNARLEAKWRANIEYLTRRDRPGREYANDAPDVPESNQPWG